MVAVALVDWVLLDVHGRILRIPPDFDMAFPNPELSEDILRVARTAPPDDAASLDLRVRPQDLDPMGHVNNAVYLDWIEEAIAAAGDESQLGMIPRNVAIEYAASAEPGDQVRALAWRDGDAWSVRLVRLSDGIDLVRSVLGGSRH